MPDLLDSITWNASQSDLNVTYSFLAEGTSVVNDGETLVAVTASDFFIAQALSFF